MGAIVDRRGALRFSVGTKDVSGNHVPFSRSGNSIHHTEIDFLPCYKRKNQLEVRKAIFIDMAIVDSA